eukprot:TRINITY_DN92723_c0_g1_i1.p1 TRINITY_DN92723_c0_g1~~TRINITY_DN92723_c0_g1_i1.p1  ORF type:complete len:491 (-),score=74.16 TRINITY_DN92723_c0_g1_i1:181-1653(-)
MTISAVPLVLDDVESALQLPDGWQKSLRIQCSGDEIRFVPSTPLHCMMLALCFINTFAGTFLVPHSPELSNFFGKGNMFAAYIVGVPYLSNVCAVYMAKWLIKRNGWLVATCCNCAFIAVGTALCFMSVVFPPLQNVWILLGAELIYGFGMGCQFIGRQLGVETSSASERNKIFSEQTTATSMGILLGTSTSGLTTMLPGAGKSAWVVGLPFAILCCIAVCLLVFALWKLPNEIVKVPATEATTPDTTPATPATPAAKQTAMSESSRKARIWATLVMGFNRVVVRSMVENETTAFYQNVYGYPEVVGSSFLALAYFVGIIALQIFSALHDRFTDRVWIYVTLVLIFSGTLCCFPLYPEAKQFETIKFAVGICLVLPGLAMNTAVANSTATRYAIKTHWLYSTEMIGLLQILTQTTLARIVGPFVGYVLATHSMSATLTIQMAVTGLSLWLTYACVTSNVAETAEGRKSLRLINSSNSMLSGESTKQNGDR